MNIKKIPPNSIEAEESVIGSILRSEEAVVRASGIITSNDFYQPDLKIIYEIMLVLYKNNRPIDLITLTEALKTSGQLEAVGGVDYLSKLALKVPTSVHIESYAKIVKEKSYLREAIKYANNIQSSAYEQNFNEVLSVIGNQPSIHLNKHLHKKTSELMQENLDDVARRFKSKDDSRGMRTGFVDLDNLTDGIKPGEIVGLWADSNVGKSIFAQDVARYVAKHYGKVALFAYETLAQNITYRMLPDEMRIDIQSFNKPKKNLTHRKQQIIKEYIPLYGDNIEIFAEELVMKTAQEIEGKIRLIDNLKLIIIDYLHLMNTNERYDNASDRFTVIERELHSIATKYTIPILLLMSQTKGNEEQAAFRGSNELKHDLDQLWNLQRKANDDDKKAREQALLIVEKGRDSSKGKIKLWYQEDYLTFKSFERYV